MCWKWLVARTNWNSVVHSLFCLKRRVRLSEEQHRTQGWNSGDELKSESRAHGSTHPIHSTAFIYVCEAKPLPAIRKQHCCWYTSIFVFHTVSFSYTVLSCLKRGWSLENSLLRLSVQIHGFMQMCGCDSSWVLITCMALADSFAADFSVLPFLTTEGISFPQDVRCATVSLGITSNQPSLNFDTCLPTFISLSQELK